MSISLCHYRGFSVVTSRRAPVYKTVEGDMLEDRTLPVPSPSWLPVTVIDRVVLNDHPVFDIRKPGKRRQKTVPAGPFAPQHSSEGVRQYYKPARQLEKQLPHVRAGITFTE